MQEGERFLYFQLYVGKLVIYRNDSLDVLLLQLVNTGLNMLSNVPVGNR